MTRAKTSGPSTAPAVISLVAATLFWAGNYVVGSVAVSQIDPISLTYLRWLIAVVPLFALAQLIERPAWRDLWRSWRWVVGLAVLGLAGYNLFLYAALTFTDAFHASLINAFNPALIALAAAGMLGNKLSPRAIAGVVVALIGVLIVLTGGDFRRLLADGFGVGDLLMFGAIAVWTLYTVVGRKAPPLEPIASTAAQALVVVVMMSPVVAWHGLTFPADRTGLGSLLYIAIFPSVLSYLLWNRALGTIAPARAGVFLNLITVFTAVITAVLGHPIAAVQILGGVVVIAGVLLTNDELWQRSAPARP